MTNDVPSGGHSAWRRAPLLRVLASQLAGAAIAFSAALLTARFTGIDVPLLGVLAGQGLFAAWIGRKLGLARWWIPAQIVLPPGAAWAAAFAVPGWVYLVAFLVLLAIYWNAVSGRVPLYLSNSRTWAAVEELLPDKPNPMAVDLGCGLGGTVFHLARARPEGRFVGIESAPLTFFVAWLRWKFGGPANAHLIYGDFWKHPLSGYDLVYAFLSPAPMARLIDKARAEMEPGAQLVSNSFTDPARPPDETRVLEDRRRTQLHIWRMTDA